MAEAAQATEARADGPPLPAHADVIVVGAGFAGIGAAIRLTKEGRDVVVIDRGDDVGGTWRDNSYPGCACDVPSHLYSFSFAPNPNWSRSFSPQEEIYEYLRATARRFGVLPKVRFNTELIEAAWRDDEQRWDVTTSRGRMTANVVIVATGGLSEPSTPSFPGLESFEGVTFHSATWRHDYDLRGKRVAVIGTGASAIQFVPHVQRRAEHLTVFQRTAPWILPRRDRAISPTERWIYRHVPFAQRIVRSLIYAGRESWVFFFAIRPAMMRGAERRAMRFLHSQVRDPKLRKALTPRYRLGCKRVLLSNDYYRAITQPNVELVTDRIVEVRPRGVVTEDASGARREHPADAIIFGTGFHVTDHPVARRVRGRDGRTLAEHWDRDGMSALRGTTVTGFPNMFYLGGPNTGLGHTSVVLMIEAQLGYIADALRKMRALGVAEIEARASAQRAYNQDIQRRLEDTVWNSGGCASWYLDAHGRNPTIWPSFTFRYFQAVTRCDLAEYEVREPRRRTAEVVS